MIADFVRYIETLVHLFRLSEKLDAAGDTISRIFKICVESGQMSDPKALENFKNWIINFDVWGSFLPLTAQSWDIHLARAAAYEKLSIFRASLHDIVRQNEKLNKQLKKSSKVHESLILTSLMTKVSIVEFYVAKIEAYMRRKHESILKIDQDENIETELTTSESLREVVPPKSI